MIAFQMVGYFIGKTNECDSQTRNKAIECCIEVATSIESVVRYVHILLTALLSNTFNALYVDVKTFVRCRNFKNQAITARIRNTNKHT